MTCDICGDDQFPGTLLHSKLICAACLAFLKAERSGVAQPCLPSTNCSAEARAEAHSDSLINSVVPPNASDPAAPDYWTYSGYNARLKKNGHFFAIVSPDGKNSLSPEAAVELVETLTRGSTKQPALALQGERAIRRNK